MSKRLDCEHLLTSLSDFIDGELSPEICRRVEAHLNGCENCRVVINTLRKTIDLYHHSDDQSSLPGEVRQRLYLRLHLEEFMNPPNQQV
ncbi:MAG: anti-sigma factor [Chloroflexota bacterium]|jgi:anti-sigma factor RsiW